MGNQASDESIAGGYILVARKTLESELMEMPAHYAKAWLWLLLKASYSDGRRLKRGQCHFTLDELAKALTSKRGYRTVQATRRVAWTVCEWFRERRMAVTTKVTRGIVLTICQYGRYQNADNYGGHNEGPTKVTTKVTQRSHESKGSKKEEEAPRKRGASLDAFDAFWAAYPKKKSKDAARERWKKLGKGRPPLDELLAAIETQKQEQQWLKNDGQYIPYPATWLHAGGWKDVAEQKRLPEDAAYAADQRQGALNKKILDDL